MASKWSLFQALIALIVWSTVSLLTACTKDSGGAGGQAPLKLDHHPVYSTKAGHPIEIGIDFKGGQVTLARLYFKTMAQTDFLYVEMKKGDSGDTFTAQLPAPQNGSGGIDYFILFEAPNTTVIKTKIFRILVTDNYRQISAPATSLQVYSENPTPQVVTRDFQQPLEVVVSPRPLTAKALAYQHEPVDIPGPGSRRSTTIFSGLGGFSATITIGGVGISYRGM